MTKYQKYQLQWMIDHDCSLSDMISEMLAMQTDGDKVVFDGDVADLFSEWEYTNGFGGEIWACEAEWKECEGKETENKSDSYRMNIREYVDCKDPNARDDWEWHIFGNVFERFVLTLPLNPDTKPDVWTDGTEILCKTEEIAERIANALDAISGEHEAHIGYYDPEEDERGGEVDDHTGWWYVDYD